LKNFLGTFLKKSSLCAQTENLAQKNWRINARKHRSVPKQGSRLNKRWRTKARNRCSVPKQEIIKKSGSEAFGYKSEKTPLCT
jgi:hypothetical protein